MEDHVHVLLSLPAKIAVAKAVQLIKGGSSKWIHDTFPEHRDFGWQEGYGAFSIGISQVAATRHYVESQAEHHGKRSFQDEFRGFLKKHGVEYDERFVWGRDAQPSLRDWVCAGILPTDESVGYSRSPLAGIEVDRERQPTLRSAKGRGPLGFCSTMLLH